MVVQHSQDVNAVRTWETFIHRRILTIYGGIGIFFTLVFIILEVISFIAYTKEIILRMVKSMEVIAEKMTF